jgi:hypothetical protein
MGGNAGTFSITALFAATLALVIAFAWNAAATKSIEHALPVRHHSDIVKITVIYALIVTMFIIFIVYILNATNKMYYKYTGNVFLNFKYMVKSSNAKFLPFWAPKSINDDINKLNKKEDAQKEESN